MNSIKRIARIGGVLYLIIIVLGIFQEAFVQGSIIVSGDVVVNAANLRSMESLWRLGIGAEFLALICTTTLAMIYFVLLRPVNKELNLLATFFTLLSLAMGGIAALGLVAALFPLGSSASLNAFTPEQLAVLAGLAVKTHTYGFGIDLLFTGCAFLIQGYLIFRSGYLPRVLGILLQIAGIGYLANSFALVLFPAIADQVFLVIALPVLVGEVSLCLWFIVKGVNVEKWEKRALEAA